MFAVQMERHHRLIKGLAVSVAFVVSASALAYNYQRPEAGLTSTDKPAAIKDVGIDQKLGQNLDLNLKFKDETGKDVTLSSYFDGKTPVIISPVYFSCPGLCNFHLNGLTEAMQKMDWNIGKQFKVLSISFDPKETPDMALHKKENYLKVYGRTGTAAGLAQDNWHFLTGTDASIQPFMQQLGFKYHWDKEQNDWAHASAAVVFSPKGEITRYLPGIMFDPKDIKLAVNEASAGKIGTFVDSLVLYCFKYDQHQSKYTLYVMNIMKMGGALTVLLLGLWLLPFWVRSRKEARKTARS
jgi:protein SCO1/2